MTGEMAKTLARKHVKDERDVLDLAMDFLSVHNDGYKSACSDIEFINNKEKK